MFAGESRVHSVDPVEPPVIAYMIVVSMRIDHAHRPLRESFYYFLYVADAHACIKEQCLLCPYNQIGDDFFLLMGLVDGKNTRPDAVHLKPFVRDIYVLQLAVGRTRQITAPLRFLAGLQSE